MIDQTVLSKGKEVAVFEDLSKGAAYKTRNEKGQFQRPVVTSRGTKSNKYKTTVTLTTCIHGYLDATAKPAIPASLIVLEYSLNAISDEHYKSAYTALEFSNINSQLAGHGPQIVAWSPHSAKTHSSKVEEKKIRDRKFEGLKVDVMGNGAEIPGTWGSSKETAAGREYFQVVQSDKNMPANSGTGHTGVWWSMQQNPDLKDGIPPTLKTATLVKRDVAIPKAKFQMKFVLNPHATKWDDYKGRFNTWCGIVEDDPVLFDPTLPILGGDEFPAESAGRLGELCAGEDLKDLGYFKNLTVRPDGDVTSAAQEGDQWNSGPWVVAWVVVVIFVLVGLLKMNVF